MKLRNKKTGEIHEITQVVFLSDDMNKKFVIYSQSKGHNYAYRNLAELNKEWEDYEESEGWWYIDRAYEAHATNSTLRSLEADREIGNYFSTKEEAELAVEKLKAWKRLKDKGYRFSKWFTRVEGGIQINVEYCKYDGIDSECRDDLDLLFGGEE